jgi:hypothetical protein
MYHATGAGVGELVAPQEAGAERILLQAHNATALAPGGKTRTVHFEESFVLWPKHLLSRSAHH